MTQNTPVQGLPLNHFLSANVANPILPANSGMTPILNDTSGQHLTDSGQLMNPAAPNIMVNPHVGQVAPNLSAPVPPVQAAQGQSAQADPNAALAPINPADGQYAAAVSDGIGVQGQAEQGQVNPTDTVQGQLANLYAASQPGMTPEWAQGAVRQAEEMLAARGLGESSIGGAAIAEAIQQSALPIAAQDASTYFQMNMANLSNRQQTTMENLKNRQQSFLSDQAAINASRQFNAANQSQIQQFMSTLISNIQTQNADRAQAMSQFNVGQENQIELQNAARSVEVQKFNAEQLNTINQFNSQARFARDQFNSQAAFAIQQSNVLWRRNLNLENTAAQNAANQFNAQNRFNMSQTAQDQLWQQWRDEASWVFQSAENQADRDFNAAMAANNGQYYQRDSSTNIAGLAGGFVRGLF